jgi:hypothetical protein
LGFGTWDLEKREETELGLGKRKTDEPINQSTN